MATKSECCLPPEIPPITAQDTIDVARARELVEQMIKDGRLKP